MTDQSYKCLPFVVYVRDCDYDTSSVDLEHEAGEGCELDIFDLFDVSTSHDFSRESEGGLYEPFCIKGLKAKVG